VDAFILQTTKSITKPKGGSPMTKKKIRTACRESDVFKACMFTAMSKVLTTEGDFNPLMDEFLEEYVKAQETVNRDERLKPYSPDEALFLDLAYFENLPHLVKTQTDIKTLLGKQGELFRSGKCPEKLTGMLYSDFVEMVAYNPTTVLDSFKLKVCKVYHEDLSDTERPSYDLLVMPADYKEERKAYTYLFKIIDKDSTVFYKRGWSYNPYKRLARLQKETKLIAELITYETWDNRQQAYKMEQKMLNTVKGKQYTPSVKFDGYTECFTQVH
jgi:hypothetical protein